MTAPLRNMRAAPIPIEEIVAATEQHRTSILRRAEEEKWTFTLGPSSGGRRPHLYTLEMLPRDVREALAGRWMLAAEQAYITKIEPEDAGRGLTVSGQKRLDARLAILDACRVYHRAKGGGVTAAWQAFAALYNTRSIALPGWVYDRVPSTSFKSLRRWDKERAAGTAKNLAGKFKGAAGNGVFDRCPALRSLVAGLITQMPHVTAKHVRDFAAARMGEQLEIDGKTVPLPHKRSFHRYIAAWKASNAELFTYATDPDAWRNKYRPVGGDAYGHVVRLNQLWEADASPADALCTDGRWAVYAVVDVYSRSLRVFLVRTVSTQSLLGGLRHCIEDWGVPEVLRTDRGSDFISGHAQRALRSLGIEHDMLPGHSPDLKGIVERHIETIQHDVIALQPGFVGHNVADRKAIEARKSFAQRQGLSDEKAFCVQLSGAELQERLNQWVERVYDRRPHGGLNGRSPFELRTGWAGKARRIEEAGALEMLLAPPADGATRTAQRRGIRVENIWYMAPELDVGSTYEVRLDPEDLSRIYCYRLDGAFVAAAVNPELAGLSRNEVAAKVKAAKKRALQDGMAQLRQDQRGINIATVSDEILAAADRGGNLVAFPRPSVTHSTPQIAAAAEAAAVRQAANEAPDLPHLRTDVSEAEIHALTAECAAEYRRNSAGQTDEDRFARWLAVQERIAAGAEVSGRDRRWHAGYRQTTEFLGLMDSYHDWPERLAELRRRGEASFEEMWADKTA